MIKSIYIFSLIITFGFVTDNNQNVSELKVIFDYKIKSIDYEMNTFRIEASLTNPTNDTINILTNSCHGLRSDILSGDSIVSKYYMWHCNGSAPEIYQLLPNSSKSIESNFAIKKYGSEFKIGFNFQQFKSYYTQEELSEISLKKDIYYHFEDLFIESKTIWGKPNRIKNK